MQTLKVVLYDRKEEEKQDSIVKTMYIDVSTTTHEEVFYEKGKLDEALKATFIENKEHWICWLGGLKKEMNTSFQVFSYFFS